MSDDSKGNSTVDGFAPTVSVPFDCIEGPDLLRPKGPANLSKTVTDIIVGRGGKRSVYSLIPDDTRSITVEIDVRELWKVYDKWIKDNVPAAEVKKLGPMKTLTDSEAVIKITVPNFCTTAAQSSF
jgi:hypothetical protein